MPAEQNLSTSTITSIMENQKKLLSLACINNGFDVGNGVTEIELFDSKNSPSIDVPPFTPQPKPSTSIASPTASRKPKKDKPNRFLDFVKRKTSFSSISSKKDSNTTTSIAGPLEVNPRRSLPLPAYKKEEVTLRRVSSSPPAISTLSKINEENINNTLCIKDPENERTMSLLYSEVVSSQSKKDKVKEVESESILSPLSTKPPSIDKSVWILPPQSPASRTISPLPKLLDDAPSGSCDYPKYSPVEDVRSSSLSRNISRKTPVSSKSPTDTLDDYPKALEGEELRKNNSLSRSMSRKTLASCKLHTGTLDDYPKALEGEELCKKNSLSRSMTRKTTSSSKSAKLDDYPKPLDADPHENNNLSRSMSRKTLSSSRSSSDESKKLAAPFWVPAHLHPEVNPQDFRRLIGDYDTIEVAMGKMPTLERKTSIKRSASFAERHVNVTAADVDGWMEEENDKKVSLSKGVASLKRSRHIRSRRSKADLLKNDSTDPSNTVKKSPLKPVTRKTSIASSSGTKKNTPLNLGLNPPPSPPEPVSEIPPPSKEAADEMDDILADLSINVEALDLIFNEHSPPATDHLKAIDESEEVVSAPESRIVAPEPETKKLGKKNSRGWSWFVGLFEPKRQPQEIIKPAALPTLPPIKDWTGFEDDDEVDTLFPSEEAHCFIENGQPRYPLHVEKNLYRLSHTKLSQSHSRRTLHEQVMISNLMLYIISVNDNVTLNRNTPISLKNKAVKKQGKKKRRNLNGIIIGNGGRAFGVAPLRSASIPPPERKNIHWDAIKSITISPSPEITQSSSVTYDDTSQHNKDDEDEVPLAMLKNKNTRTA